MRYLVFFFSSKCCCSHGSVKVSLALCENLWLLLSAVVHSSFQTGIMVNFHINFCFCTIDCDHLKKINR